MADTLRIVANLIAKDGRVDEAVQVMKDLVEPSRAEPGCLKYDVYLDAENPAKCTVLEEWAEESAYFCHFSTHHMRKALQRAEDLMATNMEVKKLSLLSAPSSQETGSADTLSVVATLDAKPGKEDAIKALLESLIEPTLAEPGCIRYELNANREDAREFVMLEEWKSEADLAAHFETPHMERALAMAPDLLAKELDLKKLKLLG